MSKDKHFDVVIIGAGASGLMCAATAGARGLKVLVLEGSNKPGKKILMSGGGRCNFTNLHITPERFISQNPHFCKSALSRYTQWDFIDLVERYQIPYEEKNMGELFCQHSAKDILMMLLAECEAAQVEVRVNAEVSAIMPIESAVSRYQLSVDSIMLTTRSLVIASGGLSIPTMGASDFGYRVAKQFGLNVLPTRAALVPLTFTDELKPLFSRLSGVTVDVEAGSSLKSFLGSLLMTHRGLSGPPILQLSSYWQEGESITLKLLPEKAMVAELLAIKQERPKALLRTILNQWLPSALVLELEARHWSDCAEKEMTHIPDRMLQAVSEALQAWQIKPAGTEGYRTAEVTLGGVDTDEVSSKTFEVKKQPGLYFIGEVLDVTGHLGGFNFQWAWSSAVAAGLAVG